MSCASESCRALSSQKRYQGSPRALKKGLKRLGTAQQPTHLSAQPSNNSQAPQCFKTNMGTATVLTMSQERPATQNSSDLLYLEVHKFGVPSSSQACSNLNDHMNPSSFGQAARYWCKPGKAHEPNSPATMYCFNRGKVYGAWRVSLATGV